MEICWQIIMWMPFFFLLIMILANSLVYWTKIKILSTCLRQAQTLDEKKKQKNKSGKGRCWGRRSRLEEKEMFVPPNTKYTGRKWKDILMIGYLFSFEPLHIVKFIILPHIYFLFSMTIRWQTPQGPLKNSLDKIHPIMNELSKCSRIAT